MRGYNVGKVEFVHLKVGIFNPLLGLAIVSPLGVASIHCQLSTHVCLTVRWPHLLQRLQPALHVNRLQRSALLAAVLGDLGLLFALALV